jgi:hypothetical protein
MNMLGVDPGVTLLGKPRADEQRTRRSERDQLVSVDGQVVPGQRVGGVLQEVSRHPVVGAVAGEVLDDLAVVAPHERGAAFPRAADEADGDALVERHGDQRRLAVARHALQRDAGRVDGPGRREVVDRAGGAPAPGPEHAPVVEIARLALRREPDDPLSEARAVVGLNGGREQLGVGPAAGENQVARG